MGRIMGQCRILKQVLNPCLFTRLICSGLKSHGARDRMKEIYKDGLTFKITSKRSDHTFELDSREAQANLMRSLGLI